MSELVTDIGRSELGGHFGVEQEGECVTSVFGEVQRLQDAVAVVGLERRVLELGASCSVVVSLSSSKHVRCPVSAGLRIGPLAPRWGDFLGCGRRPTSPL